MTLLTGTAVTPRSSGVAIPGSGKRDINWCPGRIQQHGYQIALTATLNNVVIVGTDLSAVEQALLATIAQTFTHAAGMREAKQPLFDLAVPLPHREEGDPI
jgi:hypothetical protein